MRLVDDLDNTIFSNIDPSQTGWGKAIELKYKVEDLEREVRKLKGKVKILEVMLLAEGKAYNNLVDQTLEMLE